MPDLLMYQKSCFLLHSIAKYKFLFVITSKHYIPQYLLEQKSHLQQLAKIS